MKKGVSPVKRLAGLVGLVLLAVLALQLYFVVRIALMVAINPESTAFERSEIYRIAATEGSLKWRQQWVPYDRISDRLKRAVIASEDASFIEHDGVDLEALEKALDKNSKAEQKAQLATEQAIKGGSRNVPGKHATLAAVKAPKIIGGSTITQQLAKNLFLTGERTLARKAQELMLALLLEALLSKERILEIYLNNVEWGEGVFGAEAASQHYYRKSAATLSAYEAARLAVMLPRPRYFETRPNSGYLASRAGTIVARMGGVVIP